MVGSGVLQMTRSEKMAMVAYCVAAVAMAVDIVWRMS